MESYDLGTAKGEIVLDYDDKGSVRAAENDIDKLKKKSIEGDKGLKQLGKTLSLLGKGVKLGALAVALSQAAVGAAGLVIQLLGAIPALVSIASLSAALPGIYAGILASVLVLHAAFANVGDAIKASFDPKNAAKFKEALDKLSPSAQQFVLAIKDAAPALTNFQKGLQESFFKAAFLAGQVPRMVKALGTLKPSLNGLAGDFGELTRRVSNFALSADSISFLKSAIDTFRGSLQSLGTPLVTVLTGLRDVGGVGLPLMKQLSGAVNEVATRFGQWLSQISASGQLQTWIDLALATLSKLGDVAKNVGSILVSILGAAAQSGGGLLGTLSAITGQFADFLNSAAGSEAISSLFSSIMGLAKQLAPILTTLVGILANALGPAIAQIAGTFGPVLLDVINKLAPAFGPLVAVLANLLTAVAPLLGPIADLVSLLAGVLTVAVQNLINELGPLIEIFSQGLTAAFEQLTPVIGALAQGLPIAADAGAQLAAAFAPLIPVIVQLAGTIADTLVQVLPQLQAAAKDLVPVFVQFAQALSTSLVTSLQQVMPLIPPLIKAFVTLAPAILQVATIGIRIVTFLLQLNTAMQNARAAVANFAQALAGGLVKGLTAAYNAVVSIGTTIIAWFTTLPSKIMGVLAALPGLLKSLFVNAMNGLATVIGTAAGLLVVIFTRLPGKILDALQALPGLLRSFFTSAWASVRANTVAAWNNIIAFMRGLPGRIRSAVSSLGGLLSSLMRSAWSSVRSAFVNGANNTISYARGIPGRIRSALGNVGGLLRSAGQAIINGLMNGITSAAGRVLDYVSGLASRVKSAFNNALHIFSPSRDFRDSGINVGKGLILGMKDQLRNILATAKLLANTVIQPTLSLPAVASAAAAGVGMNAFAARSAADPTMSDRNFGPYQLQIDKDTLVKFTIDAVTGHPKVVADTADEGKRMKSWMGSGRSNG